MIYKVDENKIADFMKRHYFKTANIEKEGDTYIIIVPDGEDYIVAKCEGYCSKCGAKLDYEDSDDETGVDYRSVYVVCPKCGAEVEEVYKLEYENTYSK